MNTRIYGIMFMVTGLLFAFRSQSQSLNETARQIQKLKNASYTEILKVKFSFQDDFSVDTLNSKIAVAAKEPQIGGYYQIKTNKDVYLFDGNKAIHLNLRDTTYKMDKKAVGSQFTRSLLYWEKKIDEYLKSPSKIKTLKDTVIDKISYNQYLITVRDSVEKGQPVYDRVSIITDKKSKLPVSITSDSYGFSDDGATFGMIEQHRFVNYRINEKNFSNLTAAAVPDGFKLPVKRIKLPPLANGLEAPSMNLVDAQGNPFTLDKLKGKAVLINFGLLGCPHCINSTQMLVRLFEKYKSTDLAIVSVYQTKNDSPQAISAFDTKFDVKYPSYTTNDSAESLYHVQGYPHFFLIDRQEKIVQNYEGFYASLEQELTAKIESIK